MELSRTVSCAWPLRAALGEGPVWIAREASVYFVDIKGPRVCRLNVGTGERRTWDAPAAVGFIAPLDDGGFVCGLKTGLHRFDPTTGEFRLITQVEPDRPDNRINDGCVDVRGRLWFGTMHDPETQASGALYGLDRDGELHREDDGYVVTNGPATSPDGRTLYHTDTFKSLVYAFDIDDAGRACNRRPLIRTEGSGHPDGTTVDAEGGLWIGFWGGWRVERWSPAGEKLREVALPAANVTKIAFGGPDLKDVYATTAATGLSAAEHGRQPEAGGLFAFRSEIPGLPQAELDAGLFGRAHPGSTT
jgi:sugar lactone lactonase YvrE